MSITANLKKTYYYLKKNGISDTYYAVRERLYARTSPLYMADYTYVPVSEEELEKQRQAVFDTKCKFSILVPMYETKPEFAKAMIDSVVNQTYSDWELILADASKSDVVKDLVCGTGISTENSAKSIGEGVSDEVQANAGNDYSTDSRIRYVRISENRGISENTNEALEYATGDYVALLDHDDLLTPDALYEIMCAIDGAAKEGKEASFIYSDEDKCDTDAKIYYEPHIKLGFNWDLLLSNNYICHFLVMKTDLIKKLGFRKEYDGAQDFDLVLRASMEKASEDVILHVNKVLYHWRCHDLSTAANPQSKLYAYEAGKRAVESALKAFLTRMHGEEAVHEVGCVKEHGHDFERSSTIFATADDKKFGFYVNDIWIRVVHTKHNGFYRVEYGNGTAEDIFKARKDVGIVAGSVVEHGKITSGILNEEGCCEYAGLPVKFSGYMHRMALQQDCKFVDMRNAVVCDGLLVGTNGAEEQTKELIHDLTQENDLLILFDPKFKI